jgi:CheY-like chemotaxis protein
MQLKVLVVEDDIPTLELMREVLTPLGLEVRLINDSQHASTLINQEKFDGIFLDLMMPKVDGFELARQIRQSSLNKRTPIVIVSGREDRGTVQQAFTAGGTFFLYKPVDRERLTRLLNSTRGTMLDERRRVKRVAVQTKVECQVGSRKIAGMSLNLSQSGLLFQGDGSLVPGNVGQLSFRLPRQKLPINAQGIVVRADEKQRVGVRFSKISAEDRQRIRDFIGSLADTR